MHAKWISWSGRRTETTGDRRHGGCGGSLYPDDQQERNGGRCIAVAAGQQLDRDLIPVSSDPGRHLMSNDTHPSISLSSSAKRVRTKRAITEIRYGSPSPAGAPHPRAFRLARTGTNPTSSSSSSPPC
ncbi:hypothetical protein PVAP13_6KG361612 [Panicum virgatum]|uniref:Uncharacterized protein n=1 Tax=Panicum virgatum TaxID=38727 RepID=A0A8T0RG23_PANVG|nr:hypothetical protein PVAP13_6KG361612 [Panicum virgatum]